MIENNMIDVQKKITKTLIEVLPMLRAKAKVSQEVVAEKIGISRQTYSSIETGKRDMSWTVFLALFAYFQNNEQTKDLIGKIDGLEDVVTQYLGGDAKNK